MRKLLFDVALIVALLVGLGPWLLLDAPGSGWYFVSVIAGLFIAILGMGSQMEKLGQGNTGEELLRSMWSWIKEKFRRAR
ncbi:hypothetical protein [Variovorax sp. JS1663]|uniref:hypothetical protein n=1 Tax=Variovorax sp. JS1663 TaxID=1851577 RepID=UPI00117D422F|nr:hypothetical protein [Variovorax sp. JS1663]